VTRTMRRRTAAQGVGSRSRPDVEDALERFLDMANESLAGGPFLEGRASPGRGDLSLAALLAQVGWRQTMPAVLASVRTRGALHAHVGCVFEACGLQRPAGFAEADHSPLT